MMKSYLHLSLASLAFILLANFSSQDSTVNGGVKPAVNFYGTVTDFRETFTAENITIDRLYKAIPVYQQAPVESTVAYDPADNITRLDLSEIERITVAPGQKEQRFGNRNYVVIEVYSKDHQQSKNTYIVDADKRLFFDQKNPAGPIEKEIKLRSVVEIVIQGYKQQEPDPILNKNQTAPAAQPIKTASGKPSKTKRLFSYVKNAFRVGIII